MNIYNPNDLLYTNSFVENKKFKNNLNINNKKRIKKKLIRKTNETSNFVMEDKNVIKMSNTRPWPSLNNRSTYPILSDYNPRYW